MEAPVPIKEQSERASDSTGAVALELSYKTCEVYSSTESQTAPAKLRAAWDKADEAATTVQQ